ncbi:MAG: hypothetical protein E7001_03225 [Coriobacteriaceae bacterium]|nr:hypothetical protein [Coriobacteriaceae bacterium]
MAGEIYVDRDEALSVVTSYNEEARAINDAARSLGELRDTLPSSWEGRAATAAMAAFEEAVKRLTELEDAVLAISGYVKTGADAFVDADMAIAASYTEGRLYSTNAADQLPSTGSASAAKARTAAAGASAAHATSYSSNASSQLGRG